MVTRYHFLSRFGVSRCSCLAPIARSTQIGVRYEMTRGLMCSISAARSDSAAASSFIASFAARRGRLARSRAAVKRHPDYNDSGYLQAVEAAFNNWEAIQKAGR
jgi:hypothetical protein